MLRDRNVERAERRRQASPEPFSDAAEHLRFELRRLELRLGRQVLRLRAAQLVTDDPFRGLYIPDAQVDALLAAGSEPLPAWAGNGTEEITSLLAQLDEERSQRLAARRRGGVDLPLPELARLFDLDCFEQEVVVIALAPELDRRYETLFAYVQNDLTRKRPTAGLALDLLCGGLEERLAARAAFAPEGRLLRHRLLRLVDDAQEREPALPTRYLRLHERVTGFVLGSDSLDGTLLPFTERVGKEVAGGLAGLPLDPELRSRLVRAGRLISAGGVVLLYGRAGAGKRQAAAAIARDLGRPLLAADLGRVTDLPAVLPLLRREALLEGAALLLEHLDVLLGDAEDKAARVAAAADLARDLACPSFPLLLTSEAPWEPAGLWGESPFLSFALPPPSLSERLALWRGAVTGDPAVAVGTDPIPGGELASAIRGRKPNAADDAANADGGRVPIAGDDLVEAAGKFVLTAGQIRAAARRAADLAASRGSGTPTGDDLHAGARAQSSQGLSRLAQKVEPAHGWDDIVLPKRPLQQLREIYASVRHRGRVYGDWGFEAKLSLGKGLNALFTGPSGTGKTMAASILAGALRLDLYKIDLANVVSKYIGETEKNLSRIFSEAETSNAILFFDEADALFGKRSEVKDSHDRYANIEIAYLLQRMEEYEGISILATNLRNNLDDAFARRLHHAVEFPLPDAAHRERIWRGIFPRAAPLAADVDLAFLARQFELVGGSIRNVAVAAAFLAAEEGEAIAMRHLILATARELGKLGKLPTRSDFREYYELIREGTSSSGRARAAGRLEEEL